MKRFLVLILMFLFISPANAEVLQGGIVHENGKTIIPFYFQGKINSYGVQYDDDLYHNYYYDLKGNLTQYDVMNAPRTKFPHKTISYDKNDNIISKSESVSKTEQFVYYLDGRLKAHWLGDNCYDANGNLLNSKRGLNINFN